MVQLLVCGSSCRKCWLVVRGIIAMKSWNKDGSPLTAADFKNLKCEAPGCECGGIIGSGAMIFHSKCHPHDPTWAVYRGEGVLEIECSVCDSLIAKVKLADGPRTETAWRQH